LFNRVGDVWPTAQSKKAFGAFGVANYKKAKASLPKKLTQQHVFCLLGAVFYLNKKIIKKYKKFLQNLLQNTKKCGIIIKR